MSSSNPKRGSFAALLAATLLSGLAAGALWCLLSIVIDSDTAAVLIVFAIFIALFLRWQGFADARGGIAAVIATLLAFVYAQYLFAAVRMADLLGFPLRDTLFKMDLPFAWRIVKNALHAWDAALLVIALIVAFVATSWRRSGVVEKI